MCYVWLFYFCGRVQLKVQDVQGCRRFISTVSLILMCNNNLARSLTCAFSQVCLCYVMTHNCAFICVFTHTCALSCVCSQVCANTDARSHQFLFFVRACALICVVVCVSSHMFALMCVLSHIRALLCSRVRKLVYFPCFST